MKKFPPKHMSLAEHPSDIVAHAVTLQKQSRRFALITSVAIAGGAAREVGSLAVVDEDGVMTGYLSNGCIDRDIQLHAMDALKSGMKKLVRYGDGSQFFDLKLPCGGALSVLIDPAPDNAALSGLHRDLCNRQAGDLSFELPVGSEGAATSVTFTYTPQFRVVIAGRGAIFRAMAQVGHSVGFQICCLSPDEDDLAAVEDICERPPTHLISPRQGISLDEVDNYSAFLTLFHDHDWEPGLLCAALNTPAQFIGSLGSRRTHALRLRQLREMKVPEDKLARLNGPIGLVPSLRDAPLIAISTLAEIVSGLAPGVSAALPSAGVQFSRSA